MDENIIHKRTMKDIHNFYNNANKINMHKQILDKMHELYVNKNKDYGDSVSKTYKKYGLTSFLVRMEDKLNRVETLTKNEESKVKDEKIEDTLLDLANYSILAIIELKSNKNMELNENNVLKEKIKNLEEQNHKILENSIYVTRDMIPKQKVKDVIEKITNYEIPRATSTGYCCDFFINPEYKNDFIKLFNNLLEDK